MEKTDPNLFLRDLPSAPNNFLREFEDVLSTDLLLQSANIHRAILILPFVIYLEFARIATKASSAIKAICERSIGLGTLIEPVAQRRYCVDK